MPQNGTRVSKWVWNLSPTLWQSFERKDVSERKKKRERECVHLFVCVCVCVCVKERERERNREP